MFDFLEFIICCGLDPKHRVETDLLKFVWTNLFRDKLNFNGTRNGTEMNYGFVLYANLIVAIH